MTFNQEQDYWAGYKANERALIIQTWMRIGLPSYAGTWAIKPDAPYLKT